MKVSIWDIKASSEDGIIMHFDIIVPINITNKKAVNIYVNEYLKKRFFLSNKMALNKCSFCEVESRSPNVVGQIHNIGYYITDIKNYNT